MEETTPVLDFRGLVKILDGRGGLYRISRSVEPKFEMPAFMEHDRAAGTGAAAVKEQMAHPAILP